MAARRHVTVRDVARVACAVALLAVLAADAVVGEASRPWIFDASSVLPHALRETLATAAAAVRAALRRT